MSNGLKVGLLVVIAGALGFLGYSQMKKGTDEISTRPIAGETATETGASITPPGQTGETKPGSEKGKASQDRAKTTITFDKTEHDFGKMKQGDQVECVFKITNTGNEPLIIEEAHGSCGCTVPDYPKEPIPGGQTRDIKVKFNSAGKKGAQTKTVTLTANTDPLQSILTIKADVDAPADGAAKPAGGH
jgi:hypothetical protein